MRDTFEDILEYLRQRKVAFADRFLDAYVCSIGAHIFNLYNKKAEVYVEGGTASDMRLHIFLLAPPGFSKTWFLRAFLDGPISVLADSSVECVMEGMMTEAAFTGTSIIEQGKRMVIPGRAFDYAKHIVGIEEFRDFVQMMQLDYGKNLEGAMLTALESGWVRKNLASTTKNELKYMTNLTLWAASQPFAVDISSGLSRRFIWIYWAPTKDDDEELRRARREGKNVRPNYELHRKILEGLQNIKQSIAEIEQVTFDDSVYEYIYKLGVPHYEELLYERIALGGFLMSENIGRHVHVVLNDRTKNLIAKCNIWRKDIRRGPEISQLLSIIEETGPIEREQLKGRLIDVGFTYRSATDLIKTTLSQQFLKAIKEKHPKGGRPKEIIMINA